MTPPVSRTGSVGTFKRAPASSAITPAAAHPATRSSSRAHTPAIMAGLKRLAPSNYVIPSIRSPCCARAASGHAAALPSSMMNSRRLIQPPGLRTSLGQEETTTFAPWPITFKSGVSSSFLSLPLKPALGHSSQLRVVRVTSDWTSSAAA
jgi:hypothetical protein